MQQQNSTILLMRMAVLMLLALLTLTGVTLAQPDQYSAPGLEWRTIKTKHFYVHFHEGAERTARSTAKIAEDIYGPITSLYDHEPDSRVSFIIKDISDYSNGAAYFFNNKIEIWASPLDTDLRGTHNWLRNVITHEYAHIIQIQSAMKFGRRIPALTFQWFRYEDFRREDVLYGYPNLLISYPFPGVIVPPWFAEGTSQFQRHNLTYDSWDAHRDMILRSYVLSDSMLTWGEMGSFGKTSLGNESVYNAGFNLTRYIARKFGEDKLRAISEELSRTFVFTIDAAIENVLGMTGQELYDEWAADLKQEYTRRIEPVVANRVEGELLANVGFGNFYPTYSPDGLSLAYTSNKTSDYFGQSQIYILDLTTGKERDVAPGVRSALSWSPDGKRLLYSKYNRSSTQGQVYYDLYEYDLEEGEEQQVTKGLRAFNPAFSRDGSRIVFLHELDGNINISIVDADGSNVHAVTSFTKGEQAYSPKFSPDGTQVIFAYAPRTHRSVATIGTDGAGLRVLAGDEHTDCRDPRYTPDGRSFLFAANRNGIFNIYRYDLSTGSQEQLTNVVGGAFQPAMDEDGNLAYAAYTAGGYKIARLAVASPLRTDGSSYLPAVEFTAPVSSADKDAWDWESLGNYDDSEVEECDSHSYERVFQNVMWFPTLRIDEYNPENTGLQLLKPGVMIFGSDVLQRLEFLASASMNIRGERDLYLNITYRDKLPLFSSLGLYPDLALEVFNVTRKTTAAIPFPLDTIPVDVDYNLLEFGVRLGHNLFSNKTRIEAGYSHSRYTSTLGSFTNPENGAIAQARDNLYLTGNDLSLSLHHRNMVPTRDGKINPIGFHFSLRYDYEANRYNPEGDFEIDPGSGMLVPVYQNINFHRFDLSLFAATALPWLGHTVGFRLRDGTIFGPPVDEFFSNFAGGIVGMRGYPFYSLGGNEMTFVTLHYRFPLLPNIDARLGHFLVDKLYGGVFFDIGDAVDRTTDFALQSLKKDIGFELRLETTSFSMYPTRIFFSGAYGLDQFVQTFRFNTAMYGHEWRWYFGVLFDFDLSDGLSAHRGVR